MSDRRWSFGLAGMVIVLIAMLAALGRDYQSFIIAITPILIALGVWGELKNQNKTLDRVEAQTNGAIRSRDELIRDVVQHLKEQASIPTVVVDPKVIDPQVTEGHDG
jgi:hypothetical protein